MPDPVFEVLAHAPLNLKYGLSERPGTRARRVVHHIQKRSSDKPMSSGGVHLGPKCRDLHLLSDVARQVAPDRVWTGPCFRSANAISARGRARSGSMLLQNPKGFGRRAQPTRT